MDKHGASSPYLPWDDLILEGEKKSYAGTELVAHVESKNLLVSQNLVTCLTSVRLGVVDDRDFLELRDPRDPSSYVSIAAAWEVILRADQCMHHIEHTHRIVRDSVYRIIVYAIAPLAEAGPPSWGRASKHVLEWPRMFATACDKVTAKSHQMLNSKEKWSRIYASLSVLRSACHMIMMRSSREVGPGSSEETKLDAALVYMA